MISLDNLTVSYGGWTLFDNISFLINPKDRIGLVGRNGAGKTTLLRIITGEQQPTSGSVTLNGDCTIGYLPQTMRVADTTTLVEETAKAFEEVLRLEAEIEHLTHGVWRFVPLLHQISGTQHNDLRSHQHALLHLRAVDVVRFIAEVFLRQDAGECEARNAHGDRTIIGVASRPILRPRCQCHALTHRRLKCLSVTPLGKL